MLQLNDKYKIGKKIPIKDFIPREIKPADRKKIKDNVKKCTLTYQISGEEIPSVINSEYNVQAIQFYDFEVEDMKKVAFIANIYQSLIKSPCVLRFFDSTKETYSFALKRLNQNDNSQIVVSDNLLSQEFLISLPSTDKRLFNTYINFENIISKQNKVTFYLEMYVKAYILTKDKVYLGAKDVLDNKEFWYSKNKVRGFYENLRKLELLKLSLFKASSNADKVKINKEIVTLVTYLGRNYDI